MLTTLQDSTTPKKRAVKDRPTDHTLPAMTKGELESFRRHLARAENYLEFGCGGSTRLAGRAPNIKRIWSVESDAAWVATLEKEFDAGRVSFRCPDLGPVGKWGVPTDESRRLTWSRYHADIWQELDPACLDLVLIDGRFRVACTLQAALRVRADCTIMIHDFWFRSKYSSVLPFLDEKERIDTLGVFQPKEPRAVQEIEAVLARFALNWR